MMSGEVGRAPVARVLIVDDHILLRSGLQLLLKKSKTVQVVGEASAREETLAKVQALQPDIVLLDIHLEDGSSLDIIPSVKKISPKSRVLVLTMYDDEGYLRQALAAGCDGYILKKAGAAELLAAIEVVAKGRLYVDPSLTRGLVEQAMRRSPPATPQENKETCP